ncbi:hypothetical protein [Mycobacteroides abscessus]|uniref:hypothetical protein n=1 Tax=Mycobacteroides abscessus TaxID=36809 RepID=UPI0009A8A28E|nr:hypothetical protein [Mycobacteroides abscessus]RIS77931.1 hypothetical protein D2E54_15375 [Mycobacteroides abscessus]SKQ73015.1 Uncharacterised protein [Mycobacteroides abscessus subsp. massiliense]
MSSQRWSKWQRVIKPAWTDVTARRLRGDIELTKQFLLIQLHNGRTVEELHDAATYGQWCQESLDALDVAAHSHMDVDREAFTAHWRLQAVAADVRALSRRAEVLVLVALVVAVVAIAYLMAAHWWHAATAGAGVAAIAVYVIFGAKSVLAVGPDARNANPMWGNPANPLGRRWQAATMRLVNVRRI